MMRALQLSATNELAVIETPKPKLEKGYVLVSIKAAALNHREIWISKGLYPGMKLPSILGADGAGKIVELGEDVESQWLNKEVIIYPALEWGSNPNVPQKSFRVLGMPDDGTIAEYIAVHISNVVVKPNYMSFEEAAALPIAGLTSWRALMRHGEITKESKVLITGIGGGVAQAGLLIAKAIGAEVYVTSSKNEKIDFAKKLGAMAGVNYKDEHWCSELKKLSGGIDMILDSSPLPNLDDYLKFLNIGGKIVTYGSTGSRKTTLNLSRFFLKYIQLIGTTMGSPQEFRDLISFVEKHELHPTIDSVYPFEESIQAFKALEQGNQIGKIVIRF